MNKISATEGKIYFLDYTFTPALRTLQHNDKILQLRKKPSDVLALLCAKYPDPVSQDDFLAEVWEGGYVTSQSIAQMIRSLRISLGDESKKIIVTIPKLGYQLTARPCWNEPEPKPQPEPQTEPDPKPEPQPEPQTEPGRQSKPAKRGIEKYSLGSIALDNICFSMQLAFNAKPTCSCTSMNVIPCSLPGTPLPTRKVFTPRTWFLNALAAIFFSLICIAVSMRSHPLEFFKKLKTCFMSFRRASFPKSEKI